jgi:Protein of unknown function (DUF2849).
MPKAFHPRIVSANDLLDGDVVYLDAAGGWTRALAEAAVARDAEAAEALLACAAAQQSRVVGPALADVALEPGGPRPLHFREAFRARGPSHRPDLGRQAERP